MQLEQQIERAWQLGNRVVMAVAPTGAGKTVIFSNVLSREPGATAAIAHRRELVTQMSMALARNGVRHRVVGPKQLCRDVVQLHMGELGTSYYDPRARCGVVGIDSLPSLTPQDPWLNQVQLWIGDEGHHFLKDNKWGRGVAMFPNARGLLVTATAFRADGRGLGRWNDGMADVLIEGPRMRQLIHDGYLTDYRIVAPPSDVDYSEVPTTASGDLSPAKLRAAVHRSTRIVGDVVKHYQKFAAGKLGVTFAVDVEAAVELAAAYRAAGIPAEVVSANTPALLRSHILRKFERREIMQLVNVDLFGEGFDLPAIEVISMVRKTESKALFDQQFGRVLRVMVGKDQFERWNDLTAAERRAAIAASSKPFGIVIDHVGNVQRHLPPDSMRVQTLEARERRGKSDRSGIPVRTCLNPECLAVYERILRACPYCGHVNEPGGRADPVLVDGDLEWLSAEALSKLRGDVERVDGPCFVPRDVNQMVAQSIKNRHVERQHAQNELRATMYLWAGWRHNEGDEDSMIQRRFYHTYGVDVMSAQALGKPDAEALRTRLQAELDAHAIVAIDGQVSPG